MAVFHSPFNSTFNSLSHSRQKIHTVSYAYVIFFKTAFLGLMIYLSLIDHAQCFAQTDSLTPSQNPLPSPNPNALTSFPQVTHTLQLGLSHGTPTVLEIGHLLGGFFGYTYLPFQELPSLRFHVRIHGGEVIESTRNWEVNHREVHGTSLIGWQTRIGRMGLTLWMGGGGILIVEERNRHQAKRLSSSDRDLNQTAQLITGSLNSEIELELPLFRQAGLLMRGGPQFKWVDHPWAWTVYLGVFWRLGASK